MIESGHNTILIRFSHLVKQWEYKRAILRALTSAKTTVPHSPLLADIRRLAVRAVHAASR